MSSANGKPKGPRIASISPSASPAAAAAIVAGLEQFLADTAPAAGRGPAPSPWQRAALEEGIAARQVSGSAWGHAPRSNTSTGRLGRSRTRRKPWP